MTNPVMEALMLARANERLVALKHEAAPRSWTKEARLAFLHLPSELQVYYAAREKDRDRAVRNAQSERAEALKKLKLAEARIAELERTGNNNGIIEIQNAAA